MNLVYPYLYPAYGLAYLANELSIAAKAQEWIQTIRAAVFLTALVEDLVSPDPGLHLATNSAILQRHLRDGRRPPQDYRAQVEAPFQDDWIKQWVSLQPTRRKTQMNISSGLFPHQCLQYPGDTAAHEWDSFWNSTRRTVFNMLTGLKQCFPQERLKNPTSLGPMDNAQWSAWVRDVLWALHQLIRM